MNILNPLLTGSELIQPTIQSTTEEIQKLSNETKKNIEKYLGGENSDSK